MPTARSLFVSDLKAALNACSAGRSLVVTTVAVQAIPAALDAAGRHRSLGYLSAISLGIFVLTLGFYGTQRIWLYRIYSGHSLSLGEATRLTGRYLRRFLGLGVMLGVPLAIVALAVAASRNVAVIVITFGAISYMLDVLLTFVVPELTFRTSEAKEAWAIGRTMLAKTWPESRWYVLAPGLAVLAVANVFAGAYHSIWAAALEAGAAGLVSLVLRGAVLRYYLRIAPDLPDFPPVDLHQD